MKYNPVAYLAIAAVVISAIYSVQLQRIFSAVESALVGVLR